MAPERKCYLVYSDFGVLIKAFSNMKKVYEWMYPAMTKKVHYSYFSRIVAKGSRKRYWQLQQGSYITLHYRVESIIIE